MVVKASHSQMYEQHRKRVLTAKSAVDNKTPILHAGNYIRLAKLKEDGDIFFKTIKTNIAMLIWIAGILQTTGVVNSFNQDRPILSSTLPAIKTRLRELDLANRKIGLRILNTKARLRTRRPPTAKEIANRRQYQNEAFAVPMTILSKYRTLSIPYHNDQLLRLLLRPIIYMNLEIKGTRSLGRIIIRLYTEAAPQVVLEFVRIFLKHSKEKIHFIRLFPSLWMEGELTMDSNTLTRKHIEYDMRAINHEAGAGILSFSKRHLKGFKRNHLNFSISFKPLRVLNGQRIAFGRVVRGFKILNSLQEYGTKNGKPTREIFVIKCGMYR